jgi:hypothetical protein
MIVEGVLVEVVALAVVDSVVDVVDVVQDSNSNPAKIKTIRPNLITWVFNLYSPFIPGISTNI